MLKKLFVIAAVLGFTVQVFAQDWTVCDQCGGNGQLEVEKNCRVKGDIKCPQCDGSGEDSANDRACWACDGEGWWYDTTVVDLTDTENPTVDPAFFQDSDPVMPNPDDTPPPPPLE